MYYLCIDCANDKNLKKFIQDNGVTETCSLCELSGLAVNTNDQELSTLFKTLIRYHFNEWEYNEHWGGEGLETLFYKENPILVCPVGVESLALEEVFLSLVEGQYYDKYESGVSLFAGYGKDGMPNGILRALKDEVSNSLSKIEVGLEQSNYYEFEDELYSLIQPYEKEIQVFVPQGYELYRARSGVKDTKYGGGLGFEEEAHYKPFTHADISAPPPRLASGGRINRAGVSFFYGATDIDTAISEVRPHPGDNISIGKFTSTRELKLADFSENKLIHFFQSDKKLDDEFILLNSVNIYLNKLVTDETKSHYSITQLIADSLRRIGFHGVIFNSTVGAGNNVALFYPNYVIYDETSSAVKKVLSLTYEFEDTQLVNDDEVYVI